MFKKCAEVGYVAAMLRPKGKIAKYLDKAGVCLPAGISPDEWDPFHDLIVVPPLFLGKLL